METPPWPGSTIGDQLRRFRTRRGLSLETLEKLVTPYLPDGETLGRVALNRIERSSDPTSLPKNRRGVSVDELLALAHALQVAPLDLLLPVGRLPRVTVSRGLDLDTWAAAEWFMGARPLAEEDGPFYDESPSALYGEHAALLAQAEDALYALTEAPDEDEPLSGAVRYELVYQQVRALLRLRDVMTGHDVTPPPLPQSIADHVESDRFRNHRPARTMRDRRRPQQGGDR